VRSYAARLPPLAPNADRRLFAAVLLPVSLTAAGDYGEALAEAAIYDDGFAKIVHSAQAVTADAATSGHNKLRPATDAGIDLGWDDEQVTRWLNRQLDAMRKRLGAPGNAIEAPLGVSGYRIDVRVPDDPVLSSWRSLCLARSADAAGQPAPLTFPPSAAQPVFSAMFNGELSVEPAPVRSIHAPDGRAWLPQHFTRWQGRPLVANDPTLFQLSGTSPSDANGNPMTVAPPIYAPEGLQIELRYGTRYDFRCRFADLTGGGPDAAADSVNPAPAPIASTRFLRHVPPKSVRLQTDIPLPPPGQSNVAVPTVNTIDVWRPLIGYPELLFAGIDPGVVPGLLAAAPAARAAGRAVGANDPDVTHVRIGVQVRVPAHDPGPDGVREDEYRMLYQVEVPFPPFNANDVLNPGPALHLTLNYVDHHDVAAFPQPPAGATALPIPRARDVRLRLTSVCADKPDYFGTDSVRTGLTVDVATRAAAVSEAGLFAAQPVEEELNGILLQPGADIMQRLAAQLDLAADGLRLGARPAERVVFGASAALRHTLAGDAGAITFASTGELLGHWICAVRLTVARDWTWDGVADRSFIVSRRDAAADPPRIVGEIRVPFAVPPAAITGTGTPGVDRRATIRLVFLDAVDPNPPPGKFPAILTPEWTIEPQLQGLPGGGALLARTSQIRLPIAVRPRQMPKLVAAGVALSPYQRAHDYSATSPRRRVLWFEFENSIEDENDALFARVLSYGPDPLLSGVITHLLVPVPDLPVGATTLFDVVEKALPHPPPPPPLAVDPEPIRVIVPAQPEDSSGLDQMREMTEGLPSAAGARSRYFVLPLPDGMDPDDPALFGFWTYELRVGHKKLWSTSQARFGRPLIVNGVQHPAPQLLCSAFHVKPAPPATSPPARIVVAAPFATAVFEDRRLTAPPLDPRTRMWVLLYAQVMQADRKAHRNVLLGRAPAFPRFETGSEGALLAPRTRDVMGVAEFSTQAVESALEDLALPKDSRLSVIAVELLPGDHLAQSHVALGETAIYFTLDQPELQAAGLGLTPETPGGALFAFSSVGNLVASDPLGRELGSINSRRILRCSPLTPVAPSC
jgi:hypothetical protein